MTEWQPLKVQKVSRLQQWNRPCGTQDGHLDQVFFSDKKGKMANVMLEILHGFSFV